MTLREMFPEWWCKTTFSVPENCYGDYNWLDFSIYEFFFSFVVILVIKWTIFCLLFILGRIIPYETMDKKKISPSLSENGIDILNDKIEDIQGNDLEFDEDVFSLEDSNKMTNREKYFDEDIDKEIEKSIVNITRKGVNT